MSKFVWGKIIVGKKQGKKYLPSNAVYMLEYRPIEEQFLVSSNSIVPYTERSCISLQSLIVCIVCINTSAVMRLDLLLTHKGIAALQYLVIRRGILLVA